MSASTLTAWSPMLRLLSVTIAREVPQSKTLVSRVGNQSKLGLIMIQSTTIAPSSKRPTTPILSFHVDLSPFLNEFMYVGFSASTGQLASSHYVLGWSFKINGQAQTLDLSSLPSFFKPPKKHTALTVGMSVSSANLVLIVLSVAIYFMIKMKNVDVVEDWELEIGPQRYTYHELKQATDGFSDKTLLGQGGFSRVYKGTLKNSKPDVAVKRVSHESKQGLREFGRKFRVWVGFDIGT
ncbi:L-type lectin-domain containing receptor kinase S.4-like [Gossypium australe]|uniref:L-type lectin-domain containing receptor kinase S.4-like n=1 Tax=Gossypium australe TaxID=47621 RepID=A0A5B6VSK8_9ROSI|nr:L-type lectin-domain containing receptor kinase S.4-like [Gossypium australe]